MQPKTQLLNGGLFAAALLPLAIALILCGQNLYVVWPELKDGQSGRMLLGLFLVSLPGLAAAALAAHAWRTKQTLAKSRLFALLGALVVCFYAFFYFVEPTVFMRDWLFDHEAYLMTIVSALIPLFYFLLFYLASELAIQTSRALIVSIISTVLLPVAAYLGFNLIRYLPNIGSGGHIWQIAGVALISAFSFFILRLVVYVLARNAQFLLRPGTFRLLQFLFVGAFPFIGLALNTVGPIARESQTMLGNFSAYQFWLLTAVNTMLYLLPNVKYYPAQFAFFALRCAGLIFVLYFCTVFILFLPLAVLLIAAFGLGLILLIPYFAATVQILRLRLDFAALTATGKKSAAYAALAAGVLLLPTVTLTEIYIDRVQLTQAIRFLEQPPLELNHKSSIDAKAVLRLADMRLPSLNRGRGFRRQEQNLPIYDALYRKIVFDGAELSETLRKKIHLVFGGVNEFASASRATTEPRAELGDVEVSAEAAGGLTQSDLKITMVNRASPRNVEFNERIEIPGGAFVTGHWLTIDGVEVPAQITNRNTAIWVFNRVTEAQRDPSLIYFERKDVLRWRVFPVPAAESRMARLRITHVNDAEIRIGNRKISLKAKTSGGPFKAVSGNAHLVAPATNDETVVRKPYLHFIADCSRHADMDYAADARAAADKLGLSFSGARVSYANSSLRTESAETATLTCPTMHEGFFADRAVKAVLYAQFIASSTNYPIIIVLSPLPLTVMADDLSYIAAFYGDADGFVVYDGKEFRSFHFADARLRNKKLRFNLPVRFYGGRYFGAGEQLIFPADDSLPATETALLNGTAQFYDFYLGRTTERSAAVLAAVKTGVINPSAGSLVLETEAQRRRLAEFHRKMLNARNQLDTGNEPRMSEPWSFVGVALLVIALFVWRRRKAAQAKVAWFDEES